MTQENLTKKDVVRVTLDMIPALHERLLEVCRRTGRNKTDVMRDAIFFYLEANDIQIQERTERIPLPSEDGLYPK
jgi:predicted DNA-binding protein